MKDPNTMTVQPGDTVRHRLKRHADSDFVGWVDEVTETRGVGYTIRTVAVRWIGADDDPSGTITKHAPEELERLARQGEGDRTDKHENR